jgi:allophanate hydrolase subunit 1
LTKVQIHFRLERPLDEALMSAINDAQAVYGIERIQLSPSLDSLMVEYDASRLRPADIEAILRSKGLPIEPAF